MRFSILLFFAVGAIGQVPSFKPEPVGNLKQPIPNSDIIFDVQGKAPADDKAWRTVENAAIAISETAPAHYPAGQLRSNGQPVSVQRADWIKDAQASVPAGQACYKAA